MTRLHRIFPLCGGLYARNVSPGVAGFLPPWSRACKKIYPRTDRQLNSIRLIAGDAWAK